MMSTSSTRKMSTHNRKRALIRIKKELQYVARKSEGKAEEKDIRKAIAHVVQAILS